MRAKTPLSDQIVLRLPPEMRAAIEEAADRDRRRPSSLIRNVLEDWLKSRLAEAA